MLRAAILDNSAIARSLLRTILCNGGYNVISESGVASANLARLSLLAPQLIFIALDTEHADAASVLEDLRTSSPKALIYAMSCAFTAETIRQVSEHGANGFIVKPFNGTAVLSSIRTSILKLVAQQAAQQKFNQRKHGPQQHPRNCSGKVVNPFRSFTSVSPSAVTLSTGATVNVIVVLAPPVGTRIGSSDSITVTAQSTSVTASNNSTSLTAFVTGAAQVAGRPDFIEYPARCASCF